MPKKPNCSRFIVAAIRQTRAHRHELTEQGVAQAVNLYRIYPLAMQFYTDAEFRAAVADLIGKKDILLVADVSEYPESTPSTSTSNSLGLRRLDRLPPRAPLSRSSWELDLQGRRMDGKSVGRPHLHYYQARVYVVADGIPQSTQRALDKGKEAHAIMESLKNE